MEEKNISKYVGERIKTFRLARNITQQELAEYLNTTSQTVSRYENGILETNNNILFSLADYFGVSINDFFPPVNVKFGVEVEKILQKISQELNITPIITKNIFLDLKLQNSTNLTYDNIKTAIEKWLQEKNYEIDKYNENLDRILFSKVKELSEDDKKAVLGIINAIHKDVDKELDNQ